MSKMIADYMENGFLDNIIDMFKHDKNLYPYINELISDERFRVRIGATALIEVLAEEDPENITTAIPYILPLLEDQNPMLRGDAAYLLGKIGHKEVIPYLKKKLQDENSQVRLIVKEAIEEIESKRLSK